MDRIGYFNGQIGALEEMSIPLCDRSVFFGDAVYDAVLMLDGKLFTLDLHLDRLYNSCRLTQIPFHIPRQELEREIERLTALAGPGQGMLYIQVTRGAAPRKHQYPNDPKPNLIMFITPLTLAPADKRASLVSVEDLRFSYCNIKTTNLLPNVFAAQKAAEAGADEALLHRGQRVTEAAHSSILIIKDGVVVMPPLDEYILPGITRAVVHSLCIENDIPVQMRIFTVEELLQADEVLLCSTTKNILLVGSVDGKPVGGKDALLARRLQALFAWEVLKQTGVAL